MLYLCDINIENHGINYSDGDRVVIEPSNGTEVVPTFGPFGVLQSIRIVKAGKGFIERPLIYVESETGYNAILRPVFCVDRIGDDTDGEVPDDPILGGVVSIVNCVGIVANDEFAGYINGQPYYGPTHQHRGVKMVGAQHTQRAHPLVWDSVAKSLDNYDNRFQWVNGNLLQVVRSATPTSPISTQPSTATPTPTPTPSSGGTMDTTGAGTVLPNANTGTPPPPPPPPSAPSSAPAPSPAPSPSPSPPSPPPPSPPTPPPPSPPSGGGGYYP